MTTTSSTIVDWKRGGIMQQPVTVQCPYCGEWMTIWIAIDDLGEMIRDCEVCCHPWFMQVWMDGEGEIHAYIQQS